MTRSELLESAKVSLIGSGGFIASISLAQVASVVSISVGVSTVVYIVTKTVYLIKNHGRDPGQ